MVYNIPVNICRKLFLRLDRIVDAVREGKIIVVCGPTASGKSQLALEIAKRVNGIIINADATQVYKELPILTAQPNVEDMDEVKHELYSIISCKEHFSVYRWLELVKAKIERAIAARTTPIVVGGSGLYIKALVQGLAIIPDISFNTKDAVAEMIQGISNEQIHSILAKYDPVLAARLHSNDQKRIIRGLEVFIETNVPLSKWQVDTKAPYLRQDMYLLLLNAPREWVYLNCKVRFLKMIQNGALAEAEALLNHKKLPSILGLRELLSYHKEILSLEEAISLAQRRTRNYAKRQYTWFNHQFAYDHIYDISK